MLTGFIIVYFWFYKGQRTHRSGIAVALYGHTHTH